MRLKVPRPSIKHTKLDISNGVGSLEAKLTTQGPDGMG